MILEYLITTYIDDCIDILSKEDDLAYYSIKVDFIKLFESYPDVGDMVLCNPVETLPACDRDVILVQKHILNMPEYKNVINGLKHCSLKNNVHARFFGLPVCPELHRTVFPKNVDLGCFLKVNGTVVRVTQAKMLEYQRKYVCVKCKYENLVEADFEKRYILKGPKKCGNKLTKCKCSTFTQVNLVSREYCKDYQEIKIQEQVNKLNIGTIPGSMWVVLENDLVDCCKPGDDVIICGIVRRRWRPSSQAKQSEVEIVLHANFVDVVNSSRSEFVASAPDVKDCFDEFWTKYEKCPLKGRDRILESVCPQVYGLHLVKLAVLLTVVTGSNHALESEKNSDDNDTTHVRGQCHLLLVGDPGTGKSQLLRAGADLTARSVFTSGGGSTRAGLTCAALREEGEWQLEAGALVLSDGGVCCIDEISHLRYHDRTAIHEAMEQQTISIAKAGIVCKLNTRCAVIAACNPKGHYQTDQPLSVNVSLGTPLLSRFDLIFILLDSKNKHWDKLVSSYILFGGSSESKKRWSIEKLQMYISLIGPRQMEMTKSANTILQKYYMSQRKSVSRDPSRTTVRMLDSLVRLSQAHCRLMYRTTILPVDAIMAVSLVDLSMQDCTLPDTADALHSTFQKYPDYEYLNMAKTLLTQLNLTQIWQEELLYYAKLLRVDHKTLENELGSNDSSIFAQVDDVEDSNIQLSATLVTSSYFNNEKKIEKDVINSKLSATLVKHAGLNKNVRIPTVKKTKRKRKEMVIDTNAQLKETKKIMKKGPEVIVDDDFDVRKALDSVPSVNDVFNDLGINFNINHFDEVDRYKLDKLNEKKVNKSENDKGYTKHSTDTKANTINKLKQFQYKSKSDFNKNCNEKQEVTINTCLKEGSSNLCEGKSNSQISMFETDCDIDLDI